MTREEKNRVHNTPHLWLKDGRHPVSITSMPTHEINKALDFACNLRKKMELDRNVLEFRIERLNAKIENLKNNL